MFGIFNVRTAVDACSSHRGCTDTVRETALEADSWTKIHCRIWDSNPRQYCAWLFIRALYQLRIPVAVLGQTTKRCYTNSCSGPNDQEVLHKQLFWAKRPRGVTQTAVLGQTTERCYTNSCSGPNDQECYTNICSGPNDQEVLHKQPPCCWRAGRWTGGSLRTNVPTYRTFDTHNWLISYLSVPENCFHRKSKFVPLLDLAYCFLFQTDFAEL